VEFLFQIIAETVLQGLLEIVIDFGARKLAEPPGVVIKAALVAGTATLLGWISVAIVSAPLIDSMEARLAYLILAPVIIGAAMVWLGARLSGPGQPRAVLERFGFAWLFAFIFALTRHMVMGR
jgi:hypothetical protein